VDLGACGDDGEIDRAHFFNRSGATMDMVYTEEGTDGFGFQVTNNNGFQLSALLNNGDIATATVSMNGGANRHAYISLAVNTTTDFCRTKFIAIYTP
jgi:hypothetical protein